MINPLLKIVPSPTLKRRIMAGTFQAYSIYLIYLLVTFFWMTLLVTPRTWGLTAELAEAVRVGHKLLDTETDFAPHQIEKCFTPAIITLARGWNQLSPKTQNELRAVFARPNERGRYGAAFGNIDVPYKFETPHFRLHYAMTGKHAPTEVVDFHPRNGVPDYVDLMADAAEKSYRIEIMTMGFKHPREDFWEASNGGDVKQDIYLIKFGSLGLTVGEWFDGRMSPKAMNRPPYYLMNSHIYDVAGYGKSEGNIYIETTMAHEFFHGIQMAYNSDASTGAVVMMLESSATWMEAIVYDGGRRVFQIGFNGRGLTEERLKEQYITDLKYGNLSWAFSGLSAGNVIAHQLDNQQVPLVVIDAFEDRNISLSAELAVRNDQIQFIRYNGADVKPTNEKRWIIEDKTEQRKYYLMLSDGSRLRAWTDLAEELRQRKVILSEDTWVEPDADTPDTFWKVRDQVRRRNYHIKEDEGGQLYFYEDLDGVDDPDPLGESDGWNYFQRQLYEWFSVPDVQIDSKAGVHAYGNMIWIFFMTQHFETDIMRKYLEAFSNGSKGELGEFTELFSQYGTNLVDTFKTFTVWNYFTGPRDDGRHYFNGHRIPTVFIQPTDVHHTYPTNVFIDRYTIPKHFSSRYIQFNPPPGQVIDKFAIKVDSLDLAPVDMSVMTKSTYGEVSRDLSRHSSSGLRGWGAKVIIEKTDGSSEVDEIFLYQKSQAGQITFDGFGSDIQRLTLVMINVRPGTERVIMPYYNKEKKEGIHPGEFRYVAGEPPKGRLSVPRARSITLKRSTSFLGTVKAGATEIPDNTAADPSEPTMDRPGVLVEWELEDITDIHQVAIIRKRFDYQLRLKKPSEQYKPHDTLTFKDFAAVLQAGDKNGDGIPDNDVNMVGVVRATDTRFIDVSPFQDVNVKSTQFNPKTVFYVYAVVPMNEDGIMGTPSIQIDRAFPEYQPMKHAEAYLVGTRVLQSYPNPFNPEVWIPYELAELAYVTIDIFDAAGQPVRTIDLGLKERGRYHQQEKAAYWDGYSAQGERAASGVYFYVLKAKNSSEDFIDAGKMVILK